MTPERYQKIQDVVARRQEGIIVLEDIHDPHNAQAVIRSCDCFGFQTVYFIFVNEKQFNPRKIGKLTSSSANKWMDYKVFTSVEACYEDLRANGYEISATVIAEDAESIFEADLTRTPKVAMVFGNEKIGLSEYAIKQADRRLTIPMSGMVQSLNLSVTAALMMFELTRQRQVVGFDKFTFASVKRASLVEDFASR